MDVPCPQNTEDIAEFFFSFHECVFFRLFFERFVDVTVLQILGETIDPSLRTSSSAPLCHAPPSANVGSVWCSTFRVLCRPGRGRHHLILWDASVKGVFFQCADTPSAKLVPHERSQRTLSAARRCTGSLFSLGEGRIR